MKAGIGWLASLFMHSIQLTSSSSIAIKPLVKIIVVIN